MATTVGEITLIAKIDTAQYKSGAREIEKANASIESSSNATENKSNKSFFNIANIGLAAVASAAVAAGAAIVSNIGNAVKRVDTLNNFPKVMANLGYGADESKKSINALDKGVRGLPTSLNDIASALQNIAPATDSLDEATKLTLALNNALVAGGKSAELQSSGMEQFSQAIAKGKPDMMEWRSIAAAMPGQLKQISNSLGFDNWQKMADAVSNGEISFKDVQKAIVNLNEKGLGKLPSFADQAKNAVSGMQTGFTNMQTAITRGIGSIIDAVGSKDISNAITSIGKGFESALKSTIPMISFVKKNSSVFLALAAGIGASMAASILYTNAVRALSAITKAYTAASSILTLTMSLQSQGLGLARAAWLALNIAMKANPIGLAITVVAGLAAGLAILSGKNSATTTTTNQLTTAQNNLKTALSKSKDAARNSIQAQYDYDLMQKQVLENQEAVNQALIDYGPNSLEYRIALGKQKVDEGLLADAKERVADAAWKAIEADREIVKSKEKVKEAIKEIGSSADLASVGFGNLADKANAAADAARRNGGSVPVAQTEAWTGVPMTVKSINNRKFANGTNFAPGGLSLVGERGPELIDLPRGSKVYTNQESKSMVGGITINVSGTIVSSPQDQRKFAEVIGKRLNEVLQSKGQQPIASGL